MNPFFTMPWAILLAVVIGSAGCERGATSENPAVTTTPALSKIPLTRVTAGSLQHVVQVPATVQGYETVDLMSKIDGYVGTVHVDIGDLVQAGQVLAELSVPELLDEVTRREKLVQQTAAEIDSREADVKLTEAKLQEQSALLNLKRVERDRYAKLVGGGVLNQQKLDEAQYAVEATEASLHSSDAEVNAAKAHLASSHAQRAVAQADLQKARSMADYATIKAPFAGRITRRLIDPGAFVRPATKSSGTALFRIARVDKVRIVFYLPLEEAAKLKVGEPVQLGDLRALPNITISEVAAKPLTVTRLARAFDRDSRMMRAEIDFDNEALDKEIGKRLRPGDYGKVNLTLESYEGFPTLPASAVGEDATGRFYAVRVVRVNEANVCSRVPVNVVFAKEVDNEEFMVLPMDDQIKLGDRIVASGVDEIEDGTTLQTSQLQDDSLGDAN